MNSASTFIGGRTRITSITDTRIKAILTYVCDCYLLLLKDNPIYSKDFVRKQTTFNFEDYLKAEFVDRYLIPNKQLLRSTISELEEINFSYETEKRYIDIVDSKQKKDKIDIYINKLGLTDQWQTEDENIYFVIECKRVNSKADANAYVSDIRKFCSRNYIQLRLPFEGMIAFLENSVTQHSEVTKAVNDLLKSDAGIVTTELLVNQQIHPNFKGAYLSLHKKNFEPNLTFTIYHLMFNYSTQVVA